MINSNPQEQIKFLLKDSRMPKSKPISLNSTQEISKIKNRSRKATSQHHMKMSHPVDQYEELFKEYKYKQKSIQKGELTTRHFFKMMKPKVSQMKWQKPNQIDCKQVEIKQLKHAQLVDYFMNSRGTVYQKSQDFNTLIQRCSILPRKQSDMLSFISTLKTQYVKKKKLDKTQRLKELEQ